MKNNEVFVEGHNTFTEVTGRQLDPDYIPEKNKAKLKVCDNCGLLTLQNDINCKGCNTKLRIV